MVMGHNSNVNISYCKFLSHNFSTLQYFCDNPIIGLPVLPQKHPANGTEWPKCGRIQQQASYPASWPRRRAPQSGSTRRMSGCPQSSDTPPSLENGPLRKKTVQRELNLKKLKVYRKTEGENVTLTRSSKHSDQRHSLCWTVSPTPH